MSEGYIAIDGITQSGYAPDFYKRRIGENVSPVSEEAHRKMLSLFGKSLDKEIEKIKNSDEGGRS